MEPHYLGEIRLCGFYFAPQDWAFCNGQLLPIAEFDALFALIGTTFGGDGINNFALPDLRGRIPVGASNQDNLVLGQTGGLNELPLQAVQASEGAGAEAWTADQTVDNRPAHMQLSFVIALRGVFPSPH